MDMEYRQRTGSAEQMKRSPDLGVRWHDTAFLARGLTRAAQ